MLGVAVGGVEVEEVHGAAAQGEAADGRVLRHPPLVTEVAHVQCGAPARQLEQKEHGAGAVVGIDERDPAAFEVDGPVHRQGAQQAAGQPDLPRHETRRDLGAVDGRAPLLGHTWLGLGLGVGLGLGLGLGLGIGLHCLVVPT